MTKTKDLKLNQLETDELYKTSLKIAKEAYKLIDDLTDHEGLSAKVNLRFGVADLTGGVAEALAAIYPENYESGLARARRGLFAIKNVYKLSKTLGFIDLDPAFMIELSKTSKEIDTSIMEVHSQLVESAKKEKHHEG